MQHEYVSSRGWCRNQNIIFVESCRVSEFEIIAIEEDWRRIDGTI